MLFVPQGQPACTECVLFPMQVFEYMESDLEALIKDRALILSEADVKSYMAMLLRALDVCHRHWVLHRDIKPNNFLIAASGPRPGHARPERARSAVQSPLLQAMHGMHRLLGIQVRALMVPPNHRRAAHAG